MARQRKDKLIKEVIETAFFARFGYDLPTIHTEEERRFCRCVLRATNGATNTALVAMSHVFDDIAVNRK